MKTKLKDAAPTLQKKIYFLTIPLLVSFFLILATNNIYSAPLSIGTAPTSETLKLDPGEQYNGELVVWNLSTAETTYDIFVRGFKQVENQPGTAVIMTEKEDERYLYSASSWITTSRDSITLVPNKNEKIYYQIDVPEDITEGEYNAIIAFTSENETKTTGTAALTNLSSGMPILIEVGDDFLENAELLKFETTKSFYETPNIQFETKIKNIGDTHITPIGEIVLTNIFNQEIARIEFNPNSQSILRDNTGNYTTNWDFGKFLTPENGIVLGPITAEMVLTYRSFQPGFATLNASTSFWVLPWKYIVAAVVVILATVISIRIVKKKKQHQYTPIPK